MLKKLDSGELSGFVKCFDTQSGGYTVQWSDNMEALLTEYLTGIFVVKSPNSDISKKKKSPDTDILKQKWIPFKGQNVYVKVGKTMHEARIESPVPEKWGHVVVRWDINN